MSLYDPEARAQAIACIYGPARAAGAPDSFLIRLFDRHPDDGGVELSDETEVDDGIGGTEFVPNGYAAPTVDNDDFAADDVGMSATATFAAPLEAYSDEATYWLAEDPVTTYRWNVQPLLEPLNVGSAGDSFTVKLTVFFDDNVEEA